jgi:hypothetical protein
MPRPARDPTLDERIQVPETVGDLHPILREFAKLIEEHGEKAGAVRWEQPCVAIDVSPPLIDRALRIMHALFLALEKRGLRVEITAPTEGPPRSWGTPEKFPSASGVHVVDEFVTFTLNEDHDVVTIPPPKPKPIPLPSGRMYASTWTPAPTHQHRLNGKLVLKLLTPGRSLGWGHAGHRTVWSDGKEQRVEQRLLRFAIPRYGSQTRLSSCYFTPDQILLRRRETESSSLCARGDWPS